MDSREKFHCPGHAAATAEQAWYEWRGMSKEAREKYSETAKAVCVACRLGWRFDYDEQHEGRRRCGSLS